MTRLLRHRTSRDRRAGGGCAREPAAHRQSRSERCRGPRADRASAAAPASRTATAGSTDLYAAFSALRSRRPREKVCAVTAVIAQESGFHVDPVIPDLGNIAWREIDRRAAHAAIPPGLVHEVLEIKSSDRPQLCRENRSRTHREGAERCVRGFHRLDSPRPLPVLELESDPNAGSDAGQRRLRRALCGRSPVSVSGEAEHRGRALHAARERVFRRRPSARLFDAPYDGRYLYRFADFNAGQYASRNAAFQQAP